MAVRDLAGPIAGWRGRGEAADKQARAKRFSPIVEYCIPISRRGPAAARWIAERQTERVRMCSGAAVKPHDPAGGGGTRRKDQKARFIRNNEPPAPSGEAPQLLIRGRSDTLKADHSPYAGRQLAQVNLCRWG